MKTLFIAALVFLATPAFAQDKAAEIDKIFSWVQPGMPGCVAAAAENGKVVLNRVYGQADLERRVALTPDSVFDAASIRKQFVAAAILLLVEDGRVSLTDDVRKYIPELPDYGHTITLEHMLTHTSGLRDWVPLGNFANGDYDALTMVLRQRGLNFVPGEEWAYSNSGYVLLTEIVQRVSGKKFSEFARTRLFEPLGMKATTYVDDLRQVIPNRALAYERAGSAWRLDTLLDNNRGGGGALFTTAADLLTWGDALTSGRLGTFVSAKLEEPATLNNGRKLNYARGLMIETNFAGRLLWHGGGAAGYRSVLGRYREHGLTVAVLCNAGEASDDRTMFAGRIVDYVMAGKGLRRPAPTPPPAGAAAGDVSGKAGLWFNERTGDPLRLVANGGRLGIAGGGPLLAVSADTFRIPRASLSFMSQDDFELRFISNDQFEWKSMEGQVTRYRRAKPYAPGAGELQTFAGNYESDELRASFQVTPGKEGVMVRLNEARTGGGEFRPVDPDTFQAGMVTIRFRRDAAGKIVGFDFSTPALRNIRFTRKES